MRWHVLAACLSIFFGIPTHADEVATQSVESNNFHAPIAQLPTIVRVIALHDVPSDEKLWKPVQRLSDFESIVDSHQRAIGVAFAIDEIGNLATAAHVVEESRCIWIVREDGTVVPAMVVGIDRRSDLAILRTLDATRPFEFAASPKMELADLKLLTGANSIFNSVDAQFVGENRSLPTLTRSTGRDYGNLIEFTGAARAGNSGSPLVDAAGRVIAMLCAVIERNDSPTSGFAIPLDSLCVDRLRRLARGEPVLHGYAGVELSNTSEASQPVIRIESIAKNSPAGNLLQAGDQIKTINNQPMTSAWDVSRYIDASPDQTLSVEIFRANQLLTLDLPIRTRSIQPTSISPGQFIWFNAIFPADCFDTIVTSNSIGDINQIAWTSRLHDANRLTRSIEIWRGGEREQ